MLKKIALTILLFSLNIVISQDLYVADNSYLYAKNVVVFVNDDIRLETSTSNLYFRDNAQLLQNIDSKNSDAGELSIYQNQTTNVYEYNYWCSPVGVSINGITQANVDFDGSNIHDPQDETDFSNVNSSPYLFTSAYNGTATELSNYWIYSYKNGEGYWSWKQEFDTGNIETGYGFTLKGSPNVNNILDFRGRPNNGNISVSCIFDGVDNQPSGIPNTAQTLTGNPYPSALDLKLFFANSVNNQTVLNGEIYFWEQKQKNSHYLEDYEGGYGVYTPGPLGDLFDNGTYAPAAFVNYNDNGSNNANTSGNTTDFSSNNQRRYAAIGQGFVITSNGAGGNAEFNNSMRLYLPEDSSPIGNGSVFAKNKTSKTVTQSNDFKVMSHNGVNYKAIFENPTIIPEIRLHTHINNTFYKVNVIAFRKSTPNNNTYNRFYDGRNINNLKDDAYFISEEKELVIKSINYDETERLSLGLKAENNNTQFSIKISELINIPENVNVYLFDNENNTFTDLKNGSFEVILNKGTYDNRFEITFQKNILNIENKSILEYKIFQNNNLSKLKIANPNRISIKSIKVFDISGKQVLTQNINSDSKKYIFSTQQFSDGVYIVKIESSNNQIFTKKIVVNNKNN